MFMTLFLVVWTALHLYVFWRLSSIPAIDRHISRKLLVVIAAICWASSLLRRVLDSRDLELLAQPLEMFVMNWLGILFLVFFCLLIVDVFTVFGFFLRGYVPGLRSVGLLVGVLLASVALVQGLRPPVVVDYEVRLAGLPVENDNLEIAVLSDMHVGELIDGHWLASRVEQVNAIHPDMVILLGDLFEGDSRSERQNCMNDILQGISARYGVWAVIGNHESHGGRESSVRFLEDAGVHVLHNEWSQVQPGIAIGGIDDGGHQQSFSSSSDQAMQMLACRPSGAATVFLSHRPQMTHEIASAGVGLMLSGHTHGGQIWPFNYVVGIVNPFLAGRYEVNNMPLIVSRGTGTWGPRMRLWSPGEILRITLRAQ